jgi:hypothetical protein
MTASRGIDSALSPSSVMMLTLANISGRNSPSELSIVARTRSRRELVSIAVET